MSKLKVSGHYSLRLLTEGAMVTIVFGIAFLGFGFFIVTDVKKNGVKNPKTTKARIIVQITGEKGAKIFYSILGYLFLVCGAGMVIAGIVQMVSTK
jgi:hypothetical protein